jgi:hypothetical protein
MRTLFTAWAAAAAVAAAGCGGNTTLNTAPLTDEQKAQIKQEDAEREAEEGGYGKKSKAARRN